MNAAQPLNILRKCERELQGVLQQAAESGQYDRLLEIGRWARNVAAIAAEAEEALSGSVGDSASAQGGTPRMNKATTSSPPPATTGGKRQSGRTGGAKKTTRRKAGGYPQFARQGDQLVKIGWSKKQKKEYQHKSPKHVADLLRDALLNSKADTQAVSTDGLFPLHEKDGSEVPGYQAYVCLAWLKAESLVLQEGRQGYRVPTRKRLAEALPARWQALSQV